MVFAMFGRSSRHDPTTNKYDFKVVCMFLKFLDICCVLFEIQKKEKNTAVTRAFRGPISPCRHPRQHIEGF